MNFPRMTTLRVKVRRGEGGKGGVMCERQGMAWQCKRKRQGAYGGTAKLPDQTRLRVEGCFSITLAGIGLDESRSWG